MSDLPEQNSSSLTAQPAEFQPKKIYACTLCPKSFARPFSLQEHYRLHNGDKPWQCNLCGKAFTRQYMLKDHVHSHTGERTFQCTLCNKSFFTNRILNLHLRNHLGERPFKCNICEKNFARKYDLKSHLQSHSSVKAFPCPICGKKFSRKNAITVHLPMHTGEKAYVCDVCQKSFMYKQSYNKHVYAHKEKKRFSCDVCGKKFASNEYCKLHRQVHDGHGHECHFCHKLFALKSNLGRHILKAHTAQNAGDKEVEKQSEVTEIFGTPLAEYPAESASANSPSYAAHPPTQAREKAYVCDICQKSFMYKQSYNKHVYAHTHEEIKRFSCDVCGKKFTSIEYCKLHQKIHDGLGHECHICHKLFALKSNLGRHLLKAHNVENSGDKEALRFKVPEQSEVTDGFGTSMVQNPDERASENL